jgi:hypothetical protein
MLGDWAIYQAKKELTMSADKERAKPTVVTEAQSNRHEPNSVSSSHVGMYDGGGGREEQMVYALARDRNCGIVAPAMQTRREDKNQLEIKDGRTYVSAQIAEAPADLGTSRQAFLESCCLGWGIPMSMLSSGDASGKAKLNSDSAGPETARVFREAQSDRRKKAETYISNIYTVCPSRRAPCTREKAAQRV